MGDLFPELANLFLQVVAHSYLNLMVCLLAQPGIAVARRHRLINQTIKGHKSQKEIGFQANIISTILRIKLFDLSFLFTISLDLPKEGLE